MASVLWDVGRDIKNSAKHLNNVANNAENHSKEDLIRIIQNEGNDLQRLYNDLATEYGWD